MLFILLNFNSVAIRDSYVYIGFILAGVSLLIILNGFVRMGYITHKKYLQAIEEDDELGLA